MARASLKIKKFALHSFDHQLNESLSLNLMDVAQIKQTIIKEDQDIKIKLVRPKFVHTQLKKQYLHQQIQNNEQKSVEQPQRLNQNKQFQNQNEIKIERTNQKNKSRIKKFILLSNYNKQASQNNAIQNKIDRLRKNKEEVMNSQNVRSMFNTPDRSKSYHHITLSTNTHDFRKTQPNFRRQRQCNTYVPIGYNGQILQKKVSKISELDRYQTHFINMDISVIPNNYCQQSVEKQITLTKSLHLKGKQKKSTQILFTRNDENSMFKAPLKKPSEEQARFQFERKLQNFINKNQDEKVHLTHRELRLFKQILYRKREQQYFLAQKQIQVQKQANRKQNLSFHKQTIASTKEMIKKQQVNISNLKNYTQLISVQSSQQFQKKTERKNYLKKKQIEVNFNTTRNMSKYGLSNNMRNKVIRRTWNGRQLQPQEQRTHIL